MFLLIYVAFNGAFSASATNGRTINEWQLEKKVEGSGPWYISTYPGIRQERLRKNKPVRVVSVTAKFETGNSRVQFSDSCLRKSAPNGVSRQRCAKYWCEIKMATFRNNLSIRWGDCNKSTSSCRHGRVQSRTYTPTFLLHRFIVTQTYYYYYYCHMYGRLIRRGLD
jgi:hypothetical protein